MQQDREFLLRQREKGRPGSIGTLDRINEQKIRRAAERRNAEAEQEIEATNSQAVLESLSSSGDDSDEEECTSGEEFEVVGAEDAGASSACKKAKTKILTPRLLAALDRTKTTSRNATYVLTETATSLGHDADSMNISRNSVHPARKKFRQSVLES